MSPILRRVAYVSAALGLLALACSTQDADVVALPATAPFESGTRLRAVYLEVDGLRIHRGFFDSKLGLDCAFSELAGADGLHYCLPPVARAGTYQANASCTEPLVDSFDGCHLPDFVITPPDDACLVHETIYELGAEIAYGAAYTMGASGCSSPPGGVARPLYRLGAEVPITSFVGAREGALATGGRIGILALQADDGARVRTAGWDTRHGEPAYSSGFNDSPVPWMPIRTAFLSGQVSQNRSVVADLFDDPACTQELATKYPKDAVCPLTAIVDAYGSVDSVHEIGARVVGPIYSRDETGACLSKLQAGVGLGQEYFYKVGRSRLATTFEPAQTVEVGSGRIRALYRAGTDGIPIEATDTYRDTARGGECAFVGEDPHVVLPDGSIRCLPPEASYDVCADALRCPLGRLARITHGVAAPRELTVHQEGMCGVNPVVYAIGALLESGDVGDSYGVVGIVPLETFAAATRHVE